MSFTGVFMIVAFNDSDVLVEPEDRASQQERLRHIVEQPGGHIVDFDHLISHERDTAHDEQHRTSVPRDFESRVFHSVITLTSYIIVASPAAPRMAAMT